MLCLPGHTRSWEKADASSACFGGVHPGVPPPGPARFTPWFCGLARNPSPWGLHVANIYGERLSLKHFGPKALRCNIQMKYRSGEESLMREKGVYSSAKIDVFRLSCSH